MKKQILTLIILATSFTGCAKEEEHTAETQVIEKTENQIDFQIGSQIEYGKFQLTITDFEVVKDIDGDDALIVHYDWKNNSDIITSPYFSTKADGYQEGKMTKEVVRVDNQDFSIEKSEYRPGEEVKDGKAIIAIADINKPIEIHITDLYDPGEPPVVFSLNDLSQYQ